MSTDKKIPIFKKKFAKQKNESKEGYIQRMSKEHPSLPSDFQEAIFTTLWEKL